MYRLYEEKWEPSAGPKVLPREMSTEHLRNTITLLESRPEFYLEKYMEYLKTLVPEVPGVPLRFHRAVAFELRELMTRPPMLWLKETPMYKALRAELLKRDMAEAEELKRRCACREYKIDDTAVTPGLVKKISKELTAEQQLVMCKMMKDIIKGEIEVKVIGGNMIMGFKGQPTFEKTVRTERYHF